VGRGDVIPQVKFIGKLFGHYGLINGSTHQFSTSTTFRNGTPGRCYLGWAAATYPLRASTVSLREFSNFTFSE
jgi:hypothetical protein